MNNTKKVLFSVLIANYNNGKFLVDAIDSVKRQTYPNWEIVLVDDCSTDKSHELYERLETDSRIHVYYNECNRGCGYSKHRCVELANGEICGFLDPDDALLGDALEIMVNAHVEMQSASLINSTYFITDQNLEIIGRSQKESEIPQEDSFLIDRKGISHFATFKRDSYNKTDGINVGMLRAVDHDLYYKLEEVGDVKYIDKPLYLYRNGTGKNISLGATNSKLALYWDFYSMIDACIRRGISAEKYVFPLLDELQDVSFSDGVEHVRNSCDFRLGNTLLKFRKKYRRLFSLTLFGRKDKG